jgi:hypothetical protein
LKRLLPILLLAAVLAAVPAAVWSLTGSWPYAAFLHQKMISTFEVFRHRFERNEQARIPYLIVGDSETSIDRPLTLGITLINASGGEMLVLSGLVEGTSLSVGSALSGTRWSLPAHDVEKAFISAPKNFDGVIDVTITLYSSSQDVLDTKQARFSWSGSGKGDKLPVAPPR